jgi:hypothetical protein
MELNGYAFLQKIRADFSRTDWNVSSAFRDLFEIELAIW